MLDERGKADSENGREMPLYSPGVVIERLALM